MHKMLSPAGHKALLVLHDSTISRPKGLHMSWLTLMKHSSLLEAGFSYGTDFDCPCSSLALHILSRAGLTDHSSYEQI